MNPAGKLVMESILETKGAAIVQALEGLRGELYVTLEEGTWAAWLYDLLKPRATKVVVCNLRKNALLQTGNKSDLETSFKWRYQKVAFRHLAGKRAYMANLCPFC